MNGWNFALGVSRSKVTCDSLLVLGTGSIGVYMLIGAGLASIGALAGGLLFIVFRTILQQNKWKHNFGIPILLRKYKHMRAMDKYPTICNINIPRDLTLSILRAKVS